MKKKSATKPPLEPGKLARATSITLGESDMALLDRLVDELELKNRSAVVRWLLARHGSSVTPKKRER